MSPSHLDYGPGANKHPGNVRRRRFAWGFRHWQPNAVGWALMLGPGLIAGGVVATLTRVPVLLTLTLGVAVSWAAGLAFDRLSYRPTARRTPPTG